MRSTTTVLVVFTMLMELVSITSAGLLKDAHTHHIRRMSKHRLRGRKVSEMKRDTSSAQTAIPDTTAVYSDTAAAITNTAAAAPSASAASDASSSSLCVLGAWRCMGQELQECFNGNWNRVQLCDGQKTTCVANIQGSAPGCLWASSAAGGQAVSAGSSGGTALSISTKEATAATDTQAGATDTAPVPGTKQAGATGTAAVPGVTDQTAITDTTTGTQLSLGGASILAPVIHNEAYIANSLSTGTALAATGASFSMDAVGTAGTGTAAIVDTATGTGTQTDTGVLPTTSLSQGVTGTAVGTNTANVLTDTVAGDTATATGVATNTAIGTGAAEGMPTDTATGSGTGITTGAATGTALGTGSATGASTDTATGTEAATGLATGSLSSGAASGTGVVSGTGSAPTGSFKAPHYVMYTDVVGKPLPKAADILPINRWVMAFWLAKCPDTGTHGPYDWAAKWLTKPQAERETILKDFHDNGIALMVTAFGSTDAPTTTNEDPVSLAQALASYVKDAGLDGVDIDWEDSGSLIIGTGEAWLIKFQTELRKQLPSPYIITHAPQPNYFTRGQLYKNGGYAAVHEAVGDTIDAYLVQYYNQGVNSYSNCTSIFDSSAGTAVNEISKTAGVPLEKIVVGKPLSPAWVQNSGYMEAAALGQCVSKAKGSGWNGGVMFWQWDAGGQQCMRDASGS